VFASSTHVRMEAIDGSKESFSRFSQALWDVSGAAFTSSILGAVTARPEHPKTRTHARSKGPASTAPIRTSAKHLAGLQGPADIIEGEALLEA